jgi:hypothetical protein
VGLTSLNWYLRRPLPPPRILRYAQITHDGRWKWPVGTDGSRVYFVQGVSIAQVGIAGGEIVQIPVPVPYLMGLDDVSPDGSNFLLDSKEEGSQSHKLWNIRIPGGPLRPLREFRPSPCPVRRACSPAGEDFDAAFSSDGKSVIYTTLGGDIYVVRSDGTETHKLASVGPNPPSSPVWSPDGGLIRFYKDDKLWQMSSR